jgi:CBS domain-containing protein/sporulation protein YlmC with PRC-barrel domain
VAKYLDQDKAHYNSGDTPMVYLSELIGKVVSDIDGKRIGHLKDLVASIKHDIPHPVVVAIVVKQRNGKDLIISYSNVVVLIAPAVPLKTSLQEIEPYQPAENDLFLQEDVLDKQIIDINGTRVVRVNDLELARVKGSIVVSNVDISGVGIIRRLGLKKIARRISSRSQNYTSSNFISWSDMELLQRGQSMRLKVPGDKIADLHPAELADIISEMDRAQSDEFLEKLDVKQIADTLEEVEPDFQASLVESMPDEKVADVLEEMAPDEAADLLAELPKDRSEDLLDLMEEEDAEDVRKLLAYPEDAAGGIMTTEFVTIPPDVTAEQAISILRETAEEDETIFYVYVIDSENHLIGVFSLSDLILAKPETLVTDFMNDRVVSVDLMDSQDNIAQIISKYNLLAVPVVDDQQKLHGIVTLDDALDKIIPTAWKKRLPRFYH